MKLQPLIATILLLASGGCVSSTGEDAAPTVSPLYSENSYTADSASFYGPFVAATEAQHSERYQASADYYLEALKLDPDSKFVADRAFFQLIYAGRMDDAAKIAAEISMSNVDEEDDLVHLFYVLQAFKQKNWPDVRLRMNERLGTGFGYIIAPILSAWSYAAEGDLVAAQAALAPLGENPRLAGIEQEHLAYIYDYLGDYGKAAEQYKVVTAIEPSVSLQPVIAYAHMLYKMGQKEAAREFLGQQITKYESHSFLLREGAQVTNGLAPTHQVDTPNGALSMVFYRLASEFAQNGSLQTAIVYLRVASYLTPEVSDIYFMLGSLFERLEKTDAAARAFNSIAPTSPFKKAADARRIEVLKAGGQVDLAEELTRDALIKEPGNYDMLVTLAGILQGKEKFTEAIGYFDKAIAQIKTPQENDWYVYFARGVSYERTGNWPLAERDMKMALKLNSTQPSVLNYLGYSWIDRGENVDEARTMIEEAVKARPLDGFIVDSLGWVYYLTGDYQKSVETLEKAVRLEPGDATITHHLGDAYWRVGRKVEARFQWRHALEGELKQDERDTILLKLENGLSDVKEKP
ncbi:tetratricopeptide repeat protein [Kordiimonas pumila]|uniref:Tetratricopeptide repeat protein n=1 Tax=Kordiimonas pumila TaxID=2161677 RepID=A0ABV7D7B2_9PROT|nr:tetratricopeptide repeat protein [Kordiimonas pumila]